MKPTLDVRKPESGAKPSGAGQPPQALMGSAPFPLVEAPIGRGLATAGVVLSLIWVLVILGYVLIIPRGGEAQTFGLMMTLLLVILPVALIWVIVTTLRSAQEFRAEMARLQAAVEAMHKSQLQASEGGGMVPAVDHKTELRAATPKPVEVVPTAFTSRRDAALSVPSADRKAALAKPLVDAGAEQPTLALGTPADDLRSPLQMTDFVRALQFPETPDDREGFRALRLALEDRTVAKLVRAAQDVLTLLSQEGIYMDDLKPDLCHPDLWRRFATGERGRSIAGLGGIHDQAALAQTTARMKGDPVFRDAAHHFLRTFDKTFAAFEPKATDAEVVSLSNTRTVRAFMLFGRVTGTFD